MECDSERLWKLVENVRQSVTKQRRPESRCLSDWLFNAFIDSAHTCSDKRFRAPTNILQQLPQEKIRVSFIVSLYSDEKGYSITLCPQGREGPTNLKQMFLPYEDNEIFTYLDNGEIPPVVLEVLEKTQYCFLYDGCMLCKVVNYRECTQPAQESTLMLLKPTAESLLSAVNSVAVEKSCSREERLQIESKLLVATQPPLCLDPNIEVACITNRLQYNRRKLHSPAIRRYLRRRSQAVRARMYLYSTRACPKSLRMYKFVTKKNTSSETTVEKHRKNTDCWKRSCIKPPILPCTSEELGQMVANLSRPLIPPEPAISKRSPAEVTPQHKVEQNSVPAAGKLSNPLPDVNQLLKEPKQEQSLQPPVAPPLPPPPPPPPPSQRPQLAPTSQVPRQPPASQATPHSHSQLQGPKLRPLLPTTEAALRLVRERVLTQVSDQVQHRIQKQRPIMPSPPLLRLGLAAGAGRPPLGSNVAGGAVRGPSTVFVQPVSSSVSLSSASPMLRASSSTQLPAVQLLVSTAPAMGSSGGTSRPPTSTTQVPPKLHNPSLSNLSSVQLANLPKLTHINQGSPNPPSLPITQKTTPIKPSTPSMPQLHKMPLPSSSSSSSSSSTTSSHTQKP